MSKANLETNRVLSWYPKVPTTAMMKASRYPARPAMAANAILNANPHLVAPTNVASYGSVEEEKKVSLER